MSNWNPERAKLKLEECGYTRRHLAKRVLLSLGSLQQIFKGRKPGRQTLHLLADALDTNVSYLTFESDDPNPQDAA